MKIEASAAATDQTAPQARPLGQHTLGKTFRPLVPPSSDPHLTPLGRNRPAIRIGAAGEQEVVRGGAWTPSAPRRIDHVYYQVSRQLKRHLRQSCKPPVVLVAESPRSKLLQQTVSAFGSSPSLREVANLVVAFPRTQPGESEGLADGCRKPLLLAIDRYDLYGHVAILRPRNPREEMTELLRIARDRRGVLLADESGDPQGGSGVRPSLLRLSSALRVPVISADGEVPIDGEDRAEWQGASDARDDLTHNRRLGPVARIHALLA